MDPIAEDYTCRLCTKRGRDYHEIFTPDSSSISDKINNCLPIVINRGDGLPSHICPACLTALNTSDTLRAQSLVADEFLRQQLTVVVIKQEEDISDNETKKEIPESIFCGICEIYFDDINSFDDHMEQFHASEWICNLCNENFKTSDALLQHKYLNHYDSVDNVDHVEKTEDVQNTDSIENTNDVEDRQDSDFSEDLSEKEEELVGCGTTVEAPSPCSICEVTTKTEQQMVMHKKFHEPRSMYCSHCFRSFPSPFELFCHKKKAHKMFMGQMMKWFCEECERFSANPRFLKRHVECKKIKYKCKYCGAEFLKPRQLITHQKKNHLEKTMNDADFQKYKCETCDKVYIDKITFMGHVRTHRVRLERKYGCSKCEGNFLSLTKLRAHMDDVHVKRRDRQCDLCDKAFTSDRSLMEHRKRHKLQTCQECGELFESIRILNKHLLAVHNIAIPATGKFICKECGKRFMKLRLLTDHRNIHSGRRPYICEICKGTFRTYAARWCHMQKHKNDGYYCDHCKGRFSTKGLVRRHMIIHMSPDHWKFCCTICPQKFHRKSYLITHIKKHNDTRPFQCEICETRFATDKLLLKHKKRQHSASGPRRKQVKNTPLIAQLNVI